jgi:hypothetical protein
MNGFRKPYTHLLLHFALTLSSPTSKVFHATTPAYLSTDDSKQVYYTALLSLQNDHTLNLQFAVALQT